MEGTGRKQMRTLLNKYIQLLEEAFDCGLNMDITTRLKEGDRPWFTGYVRTEGSSFNPQDEDYLQFEAYEWREVEENEEALEAVKEFIDKHKNTKNA